MARGKQDAMATRDMKHMRIWRTSTCRVIEKQATKHTGRTPIRLSISETRRVRLCAGLLGSDLLEVGLVELLERLPGAERDVRLDLLARDEHVLLGAGDLEDGLLLARGREDVRLRVLLHLANGGAFGADYEAHHLVGHAHLPTEQTVQWSTSTRSLRYRAEAVSLASSVPAA